MSKILDSRSQKLLDDLLRLFNEKGKITKNLVNECDYTASHPTYIEYFGGIKEACNLANIPYGRKKPKPNPTKEILIESLQKFNSENNRAPVTSDIKNTDYLYTINVYAKFFGSFNNAKIIAGLELSNNIQNKSEEELLLDLHQLYIILGRTPKAKDINSCIYCQSAATYCIRFGSLENAFKRLGLTANLIRCKLTNIELLNEIKQLSIKLDKTPTLKELETEYKHDSTLYNNRFGSYNNALLLLKLDANRDKKIKSDNEMLEDLIDLANELDRTPTMQDAKEANICNPMTYRLRFGSYNNALSLINLPSNITFGQPTIYNNIKFDSILESDIYKELEKYYDSSKIIHKKRYWEKTRHKCDFYIPELKLWIEVSSFYDELYVQKINFKKNITEYILKENFLFVNSKYQIRKLLENAHPK